MAESTLNLKVSDLKLACANFMGWALDPTQWDSSQTYRIGDGVSSGLRRFYFNAPTDGGGAPFDWSFLRPTSTLYLAQGGTTVTLPDDFGGIDGLATVQSSTLTSQPWQIDWRMTDWIRLQYSLFPNVIGPPAYIALDALRGTTGTQSQRWQALIFPAADQAYTLQVTYFVTPDVADGTFPYALGGPEHAETVLESCLAVMEERYDDLPNGPHAQAFQRRLMASMQQDRKKKPQKFGKNCDNSDNEQLWDRSLVHWWSGPCTYNGQSFG